MDTTHWNSLTTWIWTQTNTWAGVCTLEISLNVSIVIQHDHSFVFSSVRSSCRSFKICDHAHLHAVEDELCSQGISLDFTAMPSAICWLVEGALEELFLAFRTSFLVSYLFLTFQVILQCQRVKSTLCSQKRQKSTPPISVKFGLELFFSLLSSYAG